MAKGSKQAKASVNPKQAINWDFGRALEVIGRYVRNEAGASQVEAEQAIEYLALRPRAATKAAGNRK